jgi:hypothetical protein
VRANKFRATAFAGGSPSPAVSAPILSSCLVLIAPAPDGGVCNERVGVQDPHVRSALIAAFATGAYVGIKRTYKPFNPVLVRLLRCCGRTQDYLPGCGGLHCGFAVPALNLRRFCVLQTQEELLTSVGHHLATVLTRAGWVRETGRDLRAGAGGRHDIPGGAGEPPPTGGGGSRGERPLHLRHCLRSQD